MEYCLAIQKPLLFFADTIKNLCCFLASVLFSTDKNQIDKINIISQDTVNQQAERMLTEYGNSVLRLAYSYLHNMADARKSAAGYFGAATQNNPNLNYQRTRKSMASSCCRQLSKNRLKYNTIRQTDELMEELVAEDQDDLSFVWEAVKALPDKYREVIHLFYQEGYQTNQIARNTAYE